MKTEYIIVQAGGLGTRLGALTQNRPKALVPVNNLPLIFHLFRKFPQKRYLIVGDHRSDVLGDYLETFAQVSYLLVKADGKGNAAGIARALQYVPSGEPFMLIWSDLLLSDGFELPDIEGPCYVGVFQDIPCSWGFRNGTLEKTATTQNGVAGCFLFKEKALLNSLPEAGSFTAWLQGSSLPLTAMDMAGSCEIGTPEALHSIDPGERRCRPYNHMEFSGGRVTKTGLTDEGRRLIDREVCWYRYVQDHGFAHIPKIYSYEPLVMEQIDGDNIFRMELTQAQKEEVLSKLVGTLYELHEMERKEANSLDLMEEYYYKTLRRVRSIRDAIPFTSNKTIEINGRTCKNVLFYARELEEQVRDCLFRTRFGPIHGDCTLTNTMLDGDGNVVFIDARGYFGRQDVIGDIEYDWAKLYYSIQGRFDQFNVKRFELRIESDKVTYLIAPSGWEHMTQRFLSMLPGCDLCRLKLIHAIIWLSLASHCWEDYDSMCLALYNGLFLWNEWMEEYGWNKN